ncbi:uncharacterized protein METZ01_LOCUS159915 [marine metagenome]|uniref:Uncharacterized protein n=1 Tax=marine metagenome TaxID=408172 RepID=A0A382B0I9_9ZZZZ
MIFNIFYPSLAVWLYYRSGAIREDIRTG